MTSPLVANELGEGIRLYVGGDCASVQKRPCHLTGYRCFSAAHRPRSRFPVPLVPAVQGIVDSGAFTDSPEKRLTPELALERQLAWEGHAARLWRTPWQAEALVSYDLLIDEKWSVAGRTKERWSVREAELAVTVTVRAAAYLVTQRKRLHPRRLILACQGVDQQQYRDCVDGVLEHATPADWIGLGGWCILGLQRSWLPTFWAAMRCTLPRIAARGVKHVHLFGVLWRPPLGGLLWLADQHGLTVSVDSSGPILNSKYTQEAQAKKAGALAATWERNVELHQERLRTLRHSEFYREPPEGKNYRELHLFEDQL